MVAENITWGDRSFGNLIKNPKLPSSGYEALKELERNGLIVVARDTVSPTAEFAPWLEGQRNPATVVQKLDEPQPVQPVSIEKTPRKSVATESRVIRIHRREVFRRRWSKLTQLEQWQTAIINFLDAHGESTERSLKRTLRFDRDAVIAREALAELIRRRILKHRKQGKSVLLSIARIPAKLNGQRKLESETKKRTRSKAPGEWFIENQEAIRAGCHSQKEIDAYWRETALRAGCYNQAEFDEYLRKKSDTEA